MTAATAPALAADLDAGLRRLKLGTMRRLAPELMVTAKTQRWSPEEFLRTLLDAEIGSRDESNARVDGSYLRLDGEQWVASDRCAGTELARRALQVTLIHYQLTAADGDPKMWEILKLDPPGSPVHQDRQTLLDELVEHFGYADIAQTVNALAVDFSKANLASAATLINELADTGNVAAQELVGEVARNASDYVTAAQCWTAIDRNDPILIIIGSLAGKCRTWQQKFIQYLGGDPDALPDNQNQSGRVGWNVPGFQVIRPEADAATMALRVARRWAATQEEVKEAIGACTFVTTSGGSDRRNGTGQ